MRTVFVLWILLVVGACQAHRPESPAVRLTFSASVERNYTERGEDPSPPEHTVFSLATSHLDLALWKETVLSDSRRSNTLTLFTGLSQYVTEPFFDDKVCYKFDLPSSQSTVNASAMWLAASLHEMGLYEDVLTLAKDIGIATVDGRTCTMWDYTVGDSRVPGTTMVSYRFCVDEGGALVRVNLTNSYHNPEFVGTTLTTFRNYNFSPPAALLKPPSHHCVDLTSGKPVAPSTLVNDKDRIAVANAEAGGNWQGSESSVFLGTTLGAAKERLGTKLRPLQLPLRDSAASQLLTKAELAIPLSFDARARWPHCASIGAIRNQGKCGSCWAFAAAEVFADRLCIGGGGSNFSGSVEYMVDCDALQNGCDGGFVDDAWKFLNMTGIPSEACDPYRYCPNPELANCSAAYPAFVADSAAASPRSCPKACRDGSPIGRARARAQSAYAVAKPGNVRAMQLEIMERGPIEVAFFVFSDFMTYSNGTYFRTRSAHGPLGGHAVRILGWGVDEHGVDYWLVANSWSPEWGEEGYFRIRRGSNECGIETTPVAGLVSEQQRESEVIV